MRIKKGEVKLFISPTDWKRYELAGWKKITERSQELHKKYNEAKKLKKQGKVENVK